MYYAQSFEHRQTVLSNISIMIFKGIWTLDINIVPINCGMSISIASHHVRLEIFINFRVTNLVGGKPRLETKKE